MSQTVFFENRISHFPAGTRTIDYSEVQSANNFDVAPQYPSANQKQLWLLLAAYQHGEKLDFLTAVERYGIAALSQRTGQLIALGWPIQKEWHTTPSGAKIRRYFL